MSYDNGQAQGGFTPFGQIDSKKVFSEFRKHDDRLRAVETVVIDVDNRVKSIEELLQALQPIILSMEADVRDMKQRLAKISDRLVTLDETGK